MSSLELGFVRLPGGLRLRYRSVQADGPTALLLHSWPQSGHAWRRVAPTLAASDYFPLIPDLRGCGDSDKPTGGYDPQTRMEDMRALVAALGVGDTPVFLAAHGAEGAEVAAAYAATYPAEVAGLALLSALPDGSARVANARGDWHGDFHHTPDLPELLLEGHIEAYLRHFFRAWSHDPDMLHEVDLAVYVRALSAPGALRASLAPFRVPPPIVPIVVSAQTPLLLLVGESDPRLDRDALEAAPANHGGPITIQTIPRGGYWLPEERPDPVAAALLTFFAGVRVHETLSPSSPHTRRRPARPCPLPQAPAPTARARPAPAAHPRAAGRLAVAPCRPGQPAPRRHALAGHVLARWGRFGLLRLRPEGQPAPALRDLRPGRG